MCVCVCVCVCKESGEVTMKKEKSDRDKWKKIYIERERESVCVCVCVCVMGISVNKFAIASLVSNIIDNFQLNVCSLFSCQRKSRGFNCWFFKKSKIYPIENLAQNDQAHFISSQ